MYAEGFKAERALQHYRTIQALPLILGSDRKNDANYLDACRAKRNIVEYDYVGAVTENDANELIIFVKNFKTEVEHWLDHNHPEFA
ncbi:putative toxin-antitoxin system, antitoxin component [delta proteobacterium NaphS2]|nr:putative toxin-antitoxin system, antitoxin component [delta proteobacterium NaphS2]